MVGIEASTKLTNVRRARIAIVAFAVRRAAVLYGAVVTFISGAAEVRGAGVTVIAVFTCITATGELNLVTLVRVGQADRFRAGVVVVRALV